MKTIAALIIGAFLIPASIYAYTSPGKPAGFVTDFAQVLSAQEDSALEAELTALRQATGAEVAVVTIRAIGNDETIETFAEKLFQEWGIGSEDRDTGLLILVAPNDRQVRIEVGYGLEGAVTDLQSGNIIRKVMTPAFAEGKYGEGISGAVDALNAIITNSPEAAQYSETNSTDDKKSFDFGAIFFVGIVILNVVARMLGKTKSWWLGGVLGAVAGIIIGLIWGFISAGLIAVVLLTIIGLIFDFLVSKYPHSGGGGIWPFLGGGGRGGGGGFGGFGGGSSGGGGASGRW